jgi:hypothetical protein
VDTSSGSTLFWVVTPTFAPGSCAPLRLPPTASGVTPVPLEGCLLVGKWEKGAYVRISSVGLIVNTVRFVVSNLPACIIFLSLLEKFNHAVRFCAHIWVRGMSPVHTTTLRGLRGPSARSSYAFVRGFGNYRGFHLNRIVSHLFVALPATW